MGKLQKGVASNEASNGALNFPAFIEDEKYRFAIARRRFHVIVFGVLLPSELVC